MNYFCSPENLIIRIVLVLLDLFLMHVAVFAENTDVFPTYYPQTHKHATKMTKLNWWPVG